MPPSFEAAAGLLVQGIASRAFPAACVEVGRHDTAIWSQPFGSLTYDANSPPATGETIFDLASLTKVIATTTLVMRAVDEEALSLDDPVAAWLDSWRGADRESVTISDLLGHASGLPAYLPFFRDHTRRVEFEPAICGIPLEYPPRSQSIYSDLGFILLGFILEDSPARRPAQPAASLAEQFRKVASLVGADGLMFNPPRALRPRIAPTEVEHWRGRLLQGEVHDENAWALGGAAGHAGLFGTAADAGAFARAVLCTIAGVPALARPSTLRQFIQRMDIPGSSRALGWDTMLPSSSCGTRMSATAIGHTGFTGTSLWIDWERDLYVVLLTNRVHPTRENEQLRALRPRFHDAVLEAISSA